MIGSRLIIMIKTLIIFTHFKFILFFGQFNFIIDEIEQWT